MEMSVPDQISRSVNLLIDSWLIHHSQVSGATMGLILSRATTLVSTEIQKTRRVV